MSVRERVRAGIDKLDKHYPGWHEKIDRPINVASINDCPIGQVQGWNRYTDTLDVMGIRRCPEAYGFESDPDQETGSRTLDYAALSAEWERRLEERKNAAAQ